MSLCGFFRAALIASVMCAVPAVTWAQVELGGVWEARYFENSLERGPGPRIGEYQGLPINEAARARAEAWSSSYWTVPERQCIPHPADYGSMFNNLRMWHDTDPVTGQTSAIHTQMQWSMPIRTIWMDDRPHPSEFAPYTWQGFSTGRWEGNVLYVTTTHLKAGYTRRNGVPRSDKATLTERFMRNGDILTWIQIIEDPVYYTAPFVRSQNFFYNPKLAWPAASNCWADIELPGDQTRIPHYLPGTNPYLNEWAAEYRVPEEARRGGIETAYPEYYRKMMAMPSAVHKPVVAPGAIVIRDSPNGAPAPRAENPRPAGTTPPRTGP